MASNPEPSAVELNQCVSSSPGARVASAPASSSLVTTGGEFAMMACARWSGASTCNRDARESDATGDREARADGEPMVTFTRHLARACALERP